MSLISKYCASLTDAGKFQYAASLVTVLDSRIQTFVST